jgi:hypothetical protein
LQPQGIGFQLNLHSISGNLFKIKACLSAGASLPFLCLRWSARTVPRAVPFFSFSEEDLPQKGLGIVDYLGVH